MLVASALNSPIYDATLLLGLLTLVRKSVSGKEPLSAKVLVELYFIPRLAAILDIDHTAIRQEAAWILTNIAASEEGYVNEMIKCEIHLKLLSLLRSPSDELKEQVERRNQTY